MFVKDGTTWLCTKCGFSVYQPIGEPVPEKCEHCPGGKYSDMVGPSHYADYGRSLAVNTVSRES